MMYLRQLSEICSHDVEIAGGKAASLGELMHSGFVQVPSGFVILTSAFELLLRESGLKTEVELLSGRPRDEQKTHICRSCGAENDR